MANIFDQFIDYCMTVAAKISDTTLQAFSKKEFGKTQSINTLAKKSIFQFPVIASDSCDTASLRAIVAYIERKNALLIKIVVERIGVIDLSADDTKEDIIKRVKGFDGYVSESLNNLDPAIEMIKNERLKEKKKSFISTNLLKEHESIDVLDGLNETIKAQVRLNNKSAYTFNPNKIKVLHEKGIKFNSDSEINQISDRVAFPDEDDYEAMLNSLKLELDNTKAKISLLQVSNSKKDNNEKQKLEQKKLDLEQKKYDLENEMKRAQLKQSASQIKLAKDKFESDKEKFELESDPSKRLDKDKYYEEPEFEPDESIASKFERKYNKLSNSERNRFLKNKRIFGGQAFSKGEVIHKSGNTNALIMNERKINQAEPTMIEVSFSYYVRGVQSMSSQKITLGVKSLLHVVSASEMHELLPKSRIDDTKFLIKLGKLTSGEIKFFKDFVANASVTRRFFTGDGGGKNNWINKLKHLTEVNRLRKHLGTQILPTYSLALSVEDVETMRVNTNGKFDLFQKSQAKRFSEGLSLLNFIIIDEASEKMLWLEDASEDFDIISFDSVNSENKGMSQKDLFKVMLKYNK